MKQSYKFLVSVAIALSVLVMSSDLIAQTAENMTLLGNWGMGGGEVRAVANQGDLVYFGQGNVLVIVSFEDPANPYIAANVILDDMVEDIVWTVIDGQTYCVVSGTSLNIVNVTNPTQPSITATMALAGYGEGLAISGTYVYLADGSSGMEVVDISDPANPASVAVVAAAGSGYAEGINVSTPYAYVANGSNFTIFDISDPTSPSVLGSYDKPDGYIQDVMPRSNYAYVCDWSGGIDVVDVSNPASPTFVTNFSNPVNADIMFDGNYGYIASREDGLTVMDVSTPSAPTLVGTFQTTGVLRKVSYGAITMDGTPTGHIFTAEVSGLGAVNVSDAANGMDYSGRVNVPPPADGIAYSVLVQGNKAYVPYGDAGLRIIDVTTPSSMSQLGFTTTAGSARKMVLKGDYAYVADRAGGVEVFNVADPANIDSVTSFTQNTTNDVATSGDYVYAAMRGSGIGIIDASSPGSPTFVTNLSQFYGEGVAASGNVMAQSTWDKIYFYDISTPTSPALRDSFQLATGTTEFTIHGSYAFIHDFDTLRVVDISNLSDVNEVSKVFTNGSWDGSAFVEGNYCYANVETNGILVYDITDPSNPVEVASYDGTATVRNVYVVNGLVYSAEKEGGLSVYSNDLVTAITPSNNHVPTAFNLFQNYPNPFNPSTIISYAIPEKLSNQSVSLEVYNMLGQKVRTLVHERQTAGVYQIKWNSMDDGGHIVPAGMYFYRLSAGDMVRANKMILLK